MSAITITRTGTTPTFQLVGGLNNFSMTGDFNDATCILEWNNGIKWLAVDARTSLHSEGHANFQLPTVDMRVNVINATATLSLTGRVLSI